MLLYQAVNSFIETIGSLLTENPPSIFPSPIKIFIDRKLMFTNLLQTRPTWKMVDFLQDLYWEKILVFLGLVHLSAWFIDRKSATIFHLRTTPLQSYCLGFFGLGCRISKFQKDKDKDSEQMLKIPSLSNSECNVPILTQRISWICIYSTFLAVQHRFNCFWNIICLFTTPCIDWIGISICLSNMQAVRSAAK